SATATALGGPQWLYGQARGWAARDATTPPPPTWNTKTHAAGGTGPVGGATALAVARGHTPDKDGSSGGVATVGASRERRSPTGHTSAVGLPDVRPSTDVSRGDRNGDGRGR